MTNLTHTHAQTDNALHIRIVRVVPSPLEDDPPGRKSNTYEITHLPISLSVLCMSDGKPHVLRSGRRPVKANGVGHHIRRSRRTNRLLEPGASNRTKASGSGPELTAACCGCQFMGLAVYVRMRTFPGTTGDCVVSFAIAIISNIDRSMCKHTHAR